jgi:hypothetical protein
MGDNRGRLGRGAADVYVMVFVVVVVVKDKVPGAEEVRVLEATEEQR